MRSSCGSPGASSRRSTCGCPRSSACSPRSSVSPAPYAPAKRHAKGLGSWFRDGFAVDVQPAGAGALTWPLAFTIDATSDHKCMYSAAERAGRTMSASLAADGKWTFGAFVPGHAGCGRDGLVCTFNNCE